MAQRKNDPEGIRAKIVSAAFELFTTGGYGATSMLTIRDRAHVSSGALAHHFPAKHDLGLAVIREPLAKAIEDTWIVPITQAETAHAGVAAVFDATIAGINDSGAVSGCPLGNLAAELSGQDDAFRSEMQVLYDRWKQAIAAKLGKDAAASPSARQDAEEIAGLVVAVFSGAILMAKACQTAGPLQSCWSRLSPMLKAGAAAAA